MTIKNCDEAERLLKAIFGEDVLTKGAKVSIQVEDCDEEGKEDCPCCEQKKLTPEERLLKAVLEYEDDTDSDDNDGENGKKCGTMTLEFEYDDEDIENVGVEFDNFDEDDTLPALASAVGNIIVGEYGEDNVKLCYEAVSEFMQDLLLEVAALVEDE